MQLETQVAELQKAIELLLHNPNWREVISLSPTEIEQWARAIRVVDQIAIEEEPAAVAFG